MDNQADRKDGLLSGAWELLDSSDIAPCRAHLDHDGGRVVGAAYYDEGVGLVEGEVRGDKAVLYFIYNNLKILSKWLRPVHAVGVSGIFSRMNLFLGNGEPPFAGTYQGFYVSLRPGHGAVKAYNADTPGVERLHPPRPCLLIRPSDAADDAARGS